MKKKNIGIIAGAIVVVALLAVVIFLVIKGGSNESKLKDSLSDMGRDFYENFYYEQVGKSAEERTNLLSKFTTVGIKIDLENLSRYDNSKFAKDIKENFVNSKSKEKCNRTNTKVVIYPKSPYGKTDYTVEAILDCGFESKEK